MEKKKKETKKTTKETSSNKRLPIDKYTLFIYFFAIVIMIIIMGAVFLRGTYSVSSGKVTFRGDTGYNLNITDHYVSPPNGECAIDEYGYMDPECGHLIACICRRWSTTKAGELKDASGNITCPHPCQAVALTNGEIFTKQFSNNATYYCYSGSSYAGECDVPSPTESCYECTVGSGVAHTVTINETRAATYTGGTDCHAVEDAKCRSTPTPSPKPTNTPKPTATPTPAPTESCYECELGSGYEYTYATTPSEAQSETDGTNCHTVVDTYCTTPTRSCYACEVDSKTKTGYYNSVEDAKNGLGSDSCVIVNNASCEITPPVNPKTGINYLTIIAFFVAAIGISYTVVYLIKEN